MTQHGPHQEYEEARAVYEAATTSYRHAQDALWAAERAWEIAGDKMQRAFSVLAKGPSANGELKDGR